jgi:hypothetical protein
MPASAIETETEARRWLGHPAIRALLLGLFALTLSLVLWWPALATYPLTQTEDGPFYHRVIESAKASIDRYHELPLWNAYECGGVPLWDNPQSLVGSPLFLAMYPLNTTLSLRVWYVLHTALGFLCMWLFARRELRLSRVASVAAGVTFALTAAPLNHFGGGHTTFVPFLYAPLALVMWRRAENDRRYAVGLGCLFALMFMEGGVYPVPEVGLVLAAETLTRMWPRARVKNILVATAIFAGVFVSLSAMRLFPVIDQLRHHTRAIGVETDAITWQTLGDMFLNRSHAVRFAEQTYVWGEYIAYVGVLLLALTLVGITLTRREELWFAAVAALVFALMLGHFASWAPWHVLKGFIPPFREMRVPSRFRLLLLLFMGGWVGIAMDRLPTAVSRWFGIGAGAKTRAFVIALGLIGAGDALGYASMVVAPRFTGPAAAPRVTASTRLFFGGADSAAFLDQPRQNRGRLECWDEWNFTEGAPQWLGDVPPARSSDPNVVVEVANRTANKFVVDVDAKAPGRVHVNVPYDRGWRTDVGAVANDAKLLVVDVPAGRHRIYLEYWPHGLTAGFILSGLAALGVGVFFWRERTKRRAVPRSS